MLKYFTFAILVLNPLYADTIGGEISLGVYSHSPSGTASYTLPYTSAGTNIDVEDDFGWAEEQDILFKVYFENPLPFIPNAKFAYNSFSQAGTGTVSNFQWGFISGDGEITTDLSLQMYDITAYYELLDNFMELDAGITMRYLTGDIIVTPAANFNFAPIASFSVTLPSESVELDFWIPMLYAKARFNIPNTDISLQLEANAISYEETTFYDFELSGRYTLAMGLGLEAGYKAMHLDSEDLTDGFVVDIDSAGPYASIVLDF